MRQLPTGDLICPAEGCRSPLGPVERGQTRFLRNLRDGDCGHNFGPPSGRGGPPSAEHRWFQNRLSYLCGSLGYESIQEDFQTRADVLVHSEPPLAIEVQRWPTDFKTRTAARRRSGAHTLWLLPESAKGAKTGKELFRQPAARVRVSTRGDKRVSATPWEPGHSGPVLLWVGATVMRLDSDELKLESAGSYDARLFLREVLAGERRWYGPNAREFPFGSGWARPEDVRKVRGRRGTRSRRQTVSNLSASMASAAVQSSAPGAVKAANSPAVGKADQGPDRIAEERSAVDQPVFEESVHSDWGVDQGTDLGEGDIVESGVDASHGPKVGAASPVRRFFRWLNRVWAHQSE